MPDLARFQDLPRLYTGRARLRTQHRKLIAAINETPRDQAKVNSIRASLPRPLGDLDFWDLMFWEEPKEGGARRRSRGVPSPSTPH